LTDEERKWLIENSEVNYSSDPNFPPIEFHDGKERYSGISKDFIVLLEKMGVRFNLIEAKS
jgi:hypothetical protein